MARRFLLLASLLLIVSLLGGCASGYKEFYRPNTAITSDRIAASRAAPPTNTPIVERSSPGRADRILETYERRGYVIIGESMFNTGRNEPEESAVKQGIAVGADLVLILNPRYTGSVSVSLPITTPTSTTSITNTTATATGQGGTVNAYGSGITTTYGSQTTYVPSTVHRSDYGAVYFVKQRFSFGAFVRELDETERQRLQTNRGAVARRIVDDTPAFNADLLVGDVFTAIDGVAITNTQSMIDLLAERRGRTVTISILRNGAMLQKVIALNP